MRRLSRSVVGLCAVSTRGADHGHGSGAADHVAEEKLTAWMDARRKATLQDAGTKQYDSADESAKQFGCSELREVFTAEEKNDAD